MTARIIDGKAAAADLRAKVGVEVTKFRAATGRAPGLAVVLVGEDAASAVYVRSKGKATREAGMESFEHRLPATATQDELVALIDRLNADPAVDGILVQLPLPRQIDERVIITCINPDKDVDGFNPVNAGRLAIGLHGFVPCTPLGCLKLLQAELGDLSGKSAVVIDVGINRTEAGLVGDVDFASASEVAGAITPVPGGVGPMTIACLIRNTFVGAARTERFNYEKSL